MFRFVVIDDDEVNPACGQPGGFFVRPGAAVEGDQKGGLAGGKDAVEAVAAQPVAFGFPQREKPTGFESVRGEEAVHNGQRGHAIHVIVAVKNDVLPAFHGQGDAPGGGFQGPSSLGWARIPTACFAPRSIAARLIRCSGAIVARALSAI